jgi:hypothetical protein
MDGDSCLGGRLDLSAYALEHLFDHLAAGCEAASWESVMERIERRRLLARQAAAFEGFVKPAHSLGRCVLPAAARIGDWQRFLRYSVTAINLDGIAEALDDDEIHAGLARRGKLRFAENLAVQLPTPERRLRALAVIAATCSGSERAERVRQVRERLQELPAVSEELLIRIAARLGADLASLWQELSAKAAITPSGRHRLWLAVAGACLAAHGADDAVFLASLRQVADPEARLNGLVELWPDHGPADPRAVRSLALRLEETDGRLVWSLLLPLLARTAVCDPAAAVDTWQREAAAGPPVPWTWALIEAGGALLAVLPAAEAEQIAAGLASPIERAALWVVRLERAPACGCARQALAEVHRLDAPQRKLHFALRTLLAWPHPDPECLGLAAAVLHHLDERQYAAPVEDLARALDLVARTWPSDLARQVEAVVWSPRTGGETLLGLTERAKSEGVLAMFLQNAEGYAAVAATDEAAAFELRCQLIIRCATRLVLGGEGLAWIEEGLRRLLPDEQDRLCVAAVRGLVAGGRLELAATLVERIRSGRLKLAMRLLAGGAAESDLDLEPAALYRGAATAAAIDDECLALEALAEPAMAAAAWVDRYLDRMQGKERQTRALADVAHQVLAYETKSYGHGQQDTVAPIQLLHRSAIGTGSDAHLIDLALELVELATPLQPRRAVAEMQAVLDAILKLEGLSWPERSAAIEALLARVGPILFGARNADDRWTLSRSRAVAGFLTLLARLPFRIGASAAGRSAERWIEIPPILAATGERLPPAARRPWLADLSRPWEGAGAAERQILRLCVAPTPDRLEAARRLLAETRPDRQRVHALCYLLSLEAPETVPDLLRLLPASADRDSLCLRLLRHGWLPAEAGTSVCTLMLDPLARAHAIVGGCARVLGCETAADGPAAKAWLAELARLAARGAFDPAEPQSWPVLRRLWQSRTGDERTILAQAVVEALGQRGRLAAENALCIWMNAHLAPHIGRDVEDRTGRDLRARAAVARGLTLG